MKRLFAILLALLRAGVAFAALFADEDPDAPKWEEEVPQLPASPSDANLHEFYVSATTPHRYFIDTASLAVGKDGVVRYTLVVRTQGGIDNVTFEGMRCSTREYKIYATGHADGTWRPVRRSEWRPIRNNPTYRHHAALWHDFFCPIGNPIATPEEGRDALRLGKHPSVN
ncbi:MAG: CNP1-like family protein [Rhodocyclaceae bacterium]